MRQKWTLFVISLVGSTTTWWFNFTQIIFVLEQAETGTMHPRLCEYDMS